MGVLLVETLLEISRVDLFTVQQQHAPFGIHTVLRNGIIKFPEEFVGRGVGHALLQIPALHLESVTFPNAQLEVILHDGLVLFQDLCNLTDGIGAFLTFVKSDVRMAVLDVLKDQLGKDADARVCTLIGKIMDVGVALPCLEDLHIKIIVDAGHDDGIANATENSIFTDGPDEVLLRIDSGNVAVTVFRKRFQDRFLLLEGNVLLKPEPDRHLLPALMERIIPLDDASQIVRQKLLHPENKKVFEGTFLSSEMKAPTRLLNQPEVIRVGIWIMGIHTLLCMGAHGERPILSDEKAQGNLPCILQINGTDFSSCLLRPE